MNRVIKTIISQFLSDWYSTLQTNLTPCKKIDHYKIDFIKIITLL